MTLNEIADAVGGTVHDGPPDLLVTAPVVFHSGAVPAGGMFVALSGERVDGHDFAQAAIDGGAVAVLAARPVGVPAVVVDDVPAAYGQLAREVAARLPAMSVIALTGSVGKTTTKDLLGQVLSCVGATIAPAGNRNNELGVPETVLQASPSTRFIVVEMGARHRGDITHLTGLVRPHVAMVLNVGAAHLGEFGTVEAIAEAKGELVEALPAGGVAILNADDPRVAAMRTLTAAKVVTFGRHPHAVVQARDVTVDAGGRASFTLHTPGASAPVQLRLHGEHLVSCALAAAAAALQFTGDVALVARALSRADPVSQGRMGVTDRADGVRIINDAYNANPQSMHAALDTLTVMTRQGRRGVAVLGQMNELGPISHEAHAALGSAVAEANVAWLVAVGDGDAGVLAHTASSCGTRVTRVADADAAYQLLAAELTPGDVVLLKASHSVGLMSVAARLTSPDNRQGQSDRVS